MARAKNKTNLIPVAQISSNIESNNFFMDIQTLDSVRAMSKQPVLFSFRFLDRDHELFNLKDVDFTWYLSLLDNLREISRLNRHEFIVEQKQHYECHQHRWEKLKHRFNIPWFEQIQDECWQFTLSKSYGRVHGFMIGNRFYIVWLDKYHQLYPDDRYHFEPGPKPRNTWEEKCLEAKYWEDEANQWKTKYEDLWRECSTLLK